MAKEIDAQTWHQWLKDLHQYDDLINEVSPRFKISYDQCYALVNALTHT